MIISTGNFSSIPCPVYCHLVFLAPWGSRDPETRVSCTDLSVITYRLEINLQHPVPTSNPRNFSLSYHILNFQYDYFYDCFHEKPWNSFSYLLTKIMTMISWTEFFSHSCSSVYFRSLFVKIVMEIILKIRMIRDEIEKLRGLIRMYDYVNKI